MGLREQLAAVEAKIGELTEKREALYEQQEKFNYEKANLTVQIVLEEGLLKPFEWKALRAEYVQAQRPFSAEQKAALVKLKELTWDGYHSSHPLQPTSPEVMFANVVLHHDDNDLAISGERTGALVPFLKENGLDVSAGDLVGQLERMKQEVASLEALVNTFQV